MKTIAVDADKMRQAARRLSNEGIWAKREFWVDENDEEVAEDDPNACNRDFLFEVDYDRIVTLVVEHLSEGDPVDWINDPNLSRQEKLARFEALNPEPAHGPQETP